MVNLKLFFSKNNRDYNIVIFLGFLQEASRGISSLAIQFLYKDEFQLSPSDATFLDGLISIPWIIKPLWGFISDSFYFCGYRRKSYLIIFSIVQILILILLLSYMKQIYIGIFCLIVSSLAGAFINVICEALVVEITQKFSTNKNEIEKQNEASLNVSTFFGARYLGTLMTVYLGGVILKKINNKIIFAISAFFAFLSGMASIFLVEIKFSRNSSEIKNQKIPLENYESKIEKEKNNSEPSSEIDLEFQKEKKSKKPLICELLKFLSQKRIFYPIIFLFLLTIRPSSNKTIFYFYTNILHLLPDFIGFLQLIQSFGSILGVFIYNKYFKNVDYKKFFIYTTVVYVILDLIQIILVLRFNNDLGIPDKLFCFIDSLATDFMMELNLFPVMIIVCQLSPKNMEGTMCALMMSIYNFSGIIGNQFGGGLMLLLGITENNFNNFYLLIILTNVWVVSLLPFMMCADFGSAHKMDEIQEKEAVNVQIDEIEENSEYLQQSENEIQNKLEIITNPLWRKSKFFEMKDEKKNLVTNIENQ